MEEVRIKYHNKDKAVLKADADVINYVRAQMVYPKKQGITTVNKSCMTSAGIFKICLTGFVAKTVKDKFNKKVKIQQKVRAITKPALDGELVEIEGYEYRDNQYIPINKILKHGRGVVEVGTGGGKTLFGAGLRESIAAKSPDKNMLIIVPTKMLVNQTVADFRKYGLKKVYQYGAGKKENWGDEKGVVVIANTTSLVSTNKNTIDEDGFNAKDRAEQLFFPFDILVLDEAHTYLADTSINKFVKAFPTNNKIAMTGSVPFLNVEKRWELLSIVGSIVYKKSTHELRRDKMISEVVIKCIEVQHGLAKDHFMQADEGEEWSPITGYRKEVEYLLNSEKRWGLIKSLIKLRADGNMVILVDTNDMFDKFEEFLKENFPDRTILSIRGKTTDKARQRVIDQLEEKSNCVLVAMAKIFHVGVSVNNITYLAFVFIGKAEDKIIQSVGRVVRLHENKDEAVVFDISDDTRYSSLHALTRKVIYRKEKYNYVTKKY